MAEEVIGTFIGLTSSSYEYIANIIAPYTANFSIELGNFLLIHDSPNKIVARVIDFVPQGELVSFMGQKWLNDVAFEADAIGSDIKKRKISYSVKIKILGGLSEKNKFIPGLRRIPHITSKVVKADHDIIIKILNQALEEQQNGEEIGSYFLDDTRTPIANLFDNITSSVGERKSFKNSLTSFFVLRLAIVSNKKLEILSSESFDNKNLETCAISVNTNELIHWYYYLVKSDQT